MLSVRTKVWITPERLFLKDWIKALKNIVHIIIKLIKENSR